MIYKIADICSAVRKFYQICFVSGYIRHFVLYNIKTIILSKEFKINWLNSNLNQLIESTKCSRINCDM